MQITSKTSASDEYTFYLFTIIELLVTHAPSMHTLLLCTVVWFSTQHQTSLISHRLKILSVEKSGRSKETQLSLTCGNGVAAWKFVQNLPVLIPTLNAASQERSRCVYPDIRCHWVPNKPEVLGRQESAKMRRYALLACFHLPSALFRWVDVTVF